MSARGLSINQYLCPPGYGAERFVMEAAAAGATGIGLTIAALEELGAKGCGDIAAREGLAITTFNSAGNFLHRSEELRHVERDRNRRLVDAAADMGAGVLVVVTSGLSGQVFTDDMTLRALPIWTLREASLRAEDEIARLLEQAKDAGVQLALEPIHPMDILFKGVVSTIADAAALCGRLPGLSLVLDLYHSWWDAGLYSPPATVSGFQLCGILQENREAKPDRDVLGAGIVDAVPAVTAVTRANPDAFFEFEMFDRHRHGRDVEPLMRQAVAAWRAMHHNEWD